MKSLYLVRQADGIGRRREGKLVSRESRSEIDKEIR